MARLLKERGFQRVRPLLGGFDAWISAGYDVEGGDETPAQSGTLPAL